MIILAIPINLLIRGYKSWALRVSLLNKLECFLHQRIRRILGVTMTKLKEERIKNETIHPRFFDIQMIQNQLIKQKLTFIRKVTSNSDEKLPKKLLTAWCNNKLRVEGILHSNKKNLVQNIFLIYPTVDRYVSLKLWAHLVLDEKYWKSLINEINNAATPPPGQPHSPDTERTKTTSPPSLPRPSQGPPTSPPPRQYTRPSSIPPSQ